MIQQIIQVYQYGNYTSQFFGNIYLNEIDQYIKHKLKIKYYFRYLDDSCLIVDSKEKAIYVLNRITTFLRDNLKLSLNDKTQIFKVSQGINFCGYKIRQDSIKIRDRGKKKLKKKIKFLRYSLKNNTITIKEAKKLLNGHIGYIKHANISSIPGLAFEKYLNNCNED